ncbi:MAG: aspartate carbamoyltransferase catalytic subunit [Candidatus Nanopelagicales bacterium]|jgi:aspartate carbamoyltransferase catalytic subunit|nr:aspartate carbamoyltransferase catalytic subunit [Actinomycetes bacterium]MCH9737966.1 aspartate carbamoyltransferase catalytic subunit [Actinomycetes bacterium]MCH9830308.1 aspartate carbamoyltransferase catalytic subunit [Actinomycetes bacterium]MCH9841322.1 aspartate carbamoyltransferase catalytic subunit [Actinomycetes bacterium]
MKHLISVQDLSPQQTFTILDTARELDRVSDAGAKLLPTLRGRTVVNLFYEDSTRTRLSFERAAKRLSADVVTFSAKGSSVSKGESLKDTALTLGAMGADMIVIRHSSPGAAHRLAHAGWLDTRVLNAGDGKHEHPTQALGDAFTIRAHLRPEAINFNGLTVGIVGDVLHSRVARSNIFLLASLGARVIVIGPPTLLPVGIESWPCTVNYSLDEPLPDLDVIMMLRVQQERMSGSFFPSEPEYTRAFGLNRSRAQRLPAHAIVMHPGPMNRGVEITAEVADSTQSVIAEQVSNGMKVRMAVMYLLIGGDQSVA